MNNKAAWWQRFFLSLGILTASAAALAGGEASAPVHFDTAMVELLGELHDYAHKHKSHFQLLTDDGSALYQPINGNTAENAEKMRQSVDGQLADLANYPQSPTSANDDDIENLADVRNYLLLLDPGQYASSTEYLSSLQGTPYDLLIIDLYIEDRLLTPQEVESLKHKPQGGRRLVFAYMNIGEAETWRQYWQADWSKKIPRWMDESNEEFSHNHRVKYWRPEWKHILYGSPTAYLDEIMTAGYDGALLADVNAYQYFQSASAPAGPSAANSR